MKKYYLLTIAAGLACSMAVNAETLLPDSTIMSDAKGNNVTKFYYFYDSNQRKEKSESFGWDAAKSSWTPESNSTFTNDAAGNNIGQLYRLWDGTAFKDSQIYIYEYDDQNRMTRADLDDKDNNRHFVETYTYKGNEVYVSREDTTWKEDMKFTYSRSKVQRTLDDAGNIIKEVKQDFAGTDNGEEVWYVSQITENEYDSEGRFTKVTSNYYNKAGEVSTAMESTWTRDGKNYLQTQRVKNQSASDWMVYESKSEFTGENPEINAVFMKSATTGIWELSYKTYYYYPKGADTANELINPESTVKIFVADGSININTTESLSVQVYAINGGCYYHATVNGSAVVSGLPTGIYLVRAGNQSVKVFVK